MVKVAVKIKEKEKKQAYNSLRMQWTILTCPVHSCTLHSPSHTVYVCIRRKNRTFVQWHRIDGDYYVSRSKSKSSSSSNSTHTHTHPKLHQQKRNEALTFSAPSHFVSLHTLTASFIQKNEHEFGIQFALAYTLLSAATYLIPSKKKKKNFCSLVSVSFANNSLPI